MIPTVPHLKIGIPATQECRLRLANIGREKLVDTVLGSIKDRDEVLFEILSRASNLDPQFIEQKSLIFHKGLYRSSAALTYLAIGQNYSDPSAVPVLDEAGLSVARSRTALIKAETMLGLLLADNRPLWELQKDVFQDDIVDDISQQCAALATAQTLYMVECQAIADAVGPYPDN